MGRFARRAKEGPLSDVARTIRDQEFGSDKELDRLIKKLLSSDDLMKATPKIALEVAQSVMYEAWEAEDIDRALELAQKALTICPLCSDAYNMLAENTDAPEQARDFYQKGLEAGERILGARFFKENAGHFWGIHEARPYMRARSGLAQCLWDAGEHEAALAHYHEMLRLNPNDNQGIRYIVLACLGELGRFEELEKFMNRGYKNDCGAEWLFTKALVAFARGGASSSAAAILQGALKQNRHAPDYLIGKKKIPRRLPDRITVGGEDEGYCYASRFKAAWRKVPGARDWLKAETGKPVSSEAGILH